MPEGNVIKVRYSLKSLNLLVFCSALVAGASIYWQAIEVILLFALPFLAVLWCVLSIVVQLFHLEIDSLKRRRRRFAWREFIDDL